MNSRLPLPQPPVSTAHRATIVGMSRGFVSSIAVQRHDRGTLACLGSAR